MPPSAPYVVAANHYSHFDPPVIACGLDRPVRFLALDNLFTESRLLNWLITGYGAIPTPRQRRPIGAVRTALSALAAGEVVGVFPEATRVSHWGTLPPRRGAAWLACRAEVPLLPVAVIGTGQTFGLDNKLRRAPLRLVVGTALDSGAGETSLMTAWSEWISETISRFPGTEVSGPPRSEWDGHQG
ncbi:MAG TPA: lysophospholipid acyltransferase family protein [Acidimicrobiia bacterium]|nr:lysophospholipid acyltransferase family protein [Acidimicrobiia bacterium]